MRPLILLALLSGCAKSPASLTPITAIPLAPTEWVTPTPPEVSEAAAAQSLLLLEASADGSFYGIIWPDMSGMDPLERADALSQTMGTKTIAMSELVGNYQAVLHIGAWEPSLDALLGLGMVHLEMAAFVENAPAPDDLKGRRLDRYQESLDASAARHYTDAWSSLNELVTRTGAYRWYGPQRRAALAILKANAPSDYDVVPEEMPAPPTPVDRRGRDEELDAGYAAWEAGDTKRAAHHFGSVIESAYWHYKPNPAELTGGRFLSLVELAYARDANSREAALALGLLAHENDDPSLALDAFSAIPLRADASPEEMLVKAVSWRADRDLAGARALYKMALQSNPEDQLAAWNLSTLYAEYQGDYARAREVLTPWADEEAVQERLEELEWLESRGTRAPLAIAELRATEGALGALEFAVIDYERVVKAARCPLNDEALEAPELALEQARAALERGEHDKALETVRRLVWFTIMVQEMAPTCDTAHLR